MTTTTVSVMDPDGEVRGAVQLAFRVFGETGSAYAAVQRFARDGLRFPKRANGGVWASTALGPQIVLDKCSRAAYLPEWKHKARSNARCLSRNRSNRSDDCCWPTARTPVVLLLHRRHVVISVSSTPAAMRNPRAASRRCASSSQPVISCRS